MLNTIYEHYLDFWACGFLITAGGLATHLSVGRYFRLPSRVFFWCALYIILVIGFYFSFSLGQEEKSRIRSFVNGWAPTYAYIMEKFGVDAVNFNTPPDNLQYLSLIELQKDLLERNTAISDIYIYAKNKEGKIAFLVDSETDYDRNGAYDTPREQRTPIGEVYEEVDPDMEMPFLGTAFFGQSITRDRWGTWVSAGYPIYNPDGKVIAVLGHDYDAHAWIASILEKRGQGLFPMLMLHIGVLASFWYVGRQRYENIKRDRLLKELRSSRQDLKKSEERFALAVSGSNDGIWDWNLEKQEVYFSPRVRELLDLNEEEFPDTWEAFHERLHGEDAERVKSQLQACSENFRKLMDAQFRMRNKAGQYRWVHLRGAGVSGVNGRMVRMAGSISDITDRKEDEERIIAAQKAADMANKAKSMFLANMSHEIRTPMNAIVGFSDLLAQQSGFDAVQRDHVKTIADSAHHLLGIINDVLDLSKIEADKMDFSVEPVEISVLVEEVMRIVRVRLVGMPVELVANVAPGTPAWIMADHLRLSQILLNLLGNAAKFTTRGSIQLNIAAQFERQGPYGKFYKISFEVKDTGVGIPPSKIGLLFQPFSQVDASTTRKFGGTGLGLVISRRLARMMAGDITVESESGKGSTFTATIIAKESQKPATLESTGVAAGSSDPKLRLQGRKILVAEDNPVNQKLIFLLLKNFGCEAELVFNGREAIAKLRSGAHYDLCLFDIQMPVMGGLDATRIIRQDMNSNIPIVALSAAAMKEDEEEGLRLGMNDYLVKPVNPEKLKNALLKWLS